MLGPVTLHGDYRGGGDLKRIDGLEANGFQVPSLLRTRVHQADTVPPCQHSGTALDLEHCAGASGLPSEAGVGVLVLDVLGDAWKASDWKCLT